MNQGPPLILQHDNGREFVNKVIERLKNLWLDIVIVRGRPRHPQTQGSVERANQDVERMLGNWMKHNRSTAWSVGIYQIASEKNKRVNDTIGKSPYELLYGQNPRVKINALVRDPILLSKLKSEAELEVVIGCKAKTTTEPIGVETLDSSRPLQDEDIEDHDEYIPGIVLNNIMNPPDITVITSPNSGTVMILI
jgi:hypothetical protein